MIDRIKLLNVKCGDVVYIRKYGKVRAARVDKILLEGFSGKHNSNITFTIAGQDTPEILHVSCGCNKNSKYYPSIEACINEVEPIGFIEVTDVDIAQSLGYEVTTEVTQGVGYVHHGFYRWEWDGYNPKRTFISLSCVDIVDEGKGWELHLHQSTPAKLKKLYDTREACLADNAVQVVTFQREDQVKTNPEEPQPERTYTYKEVENAVLLAGDIFDKLYKRMEQRNGGGDSIATTEVIINKAVELEKRLNRECDDPRDYIQEVENFGEEVLKEYE